MTGPAAAAFLRFPRWPASARLSAWLSPYLVWWWLDGWTSHVAFSRDVLAMAIDLGTWTLGWAGSLPLASLLLRATVDACRGRGVVPALEERALLLLPAILAADGLAVLATLDAVAAWMPWLSLMWAPHLDIALASAAALLPARGAGWAPGATPRGIDRRCLAVSIVAGVFFTAYTLFVCQMTMLHGDEAQYLRVTQSLLRDSDIDLSNNLDDEHIAEFHVLRFGVHTAPASPAGHVHSIHPVGLSVLLMPAYQLGLSLWENPRLASALWMAWLTAACVGLLDLWLRQLGLRPGAVTLTSLIAATGAPLFLFSSQLYPEVPALWMSLVTAVHLPVLANPRLWRSTAALPVAGAARLVLLAGALVLLPFFHPRYAPLALLLGLALLWEAWRSPRRQRNLGLVGMVITAGIAAHVRFNILYSGDWLGAFRPGNAWDEDALQLSTWLISLPGHWLHAPKGLALNTPVFAAAAAGALLLWRRRDPRLWLAGAFYLATAAVNGLHPDWTFGFCLPARFLLTALPSLALLLAVCLEKVHRPLPALLLALATVIGLDATVTSIRLPEMAYDGDHLAVSGTLRYYPLLVHGVERTAGALPLMDAVFWLALLAAGAAVAVTRDRRWRLAATAFLMLWPGLWGRTFDIGPRMRAQWTPFLNALAADGAIGIPTVSSRLIPHKAPGTGRALSAGGRRAQAEENGAGILAAYFMPVQKPGIFKVRTDSVIVEESPRSRYMLRLRDTLPAVQHWERRIFYPIRARGDGTSRFDYAVDRVALGYLSIGFDGRGVLQVGTTSVEYQRFILDFEAREVARFDFAGAEAPILAAHEMIGRGRYRASFRVEGSAWRSWWQRQPPAVRMAVFLTDREMDPVSAQRGVAAWMQDTRPPEQLLGEASATVPQVDLLTAPWWVDLPFGGLRPFELTFHVPHAARVWLVYQYDGDADLALEEIILYRQSLSPTEVP